MRIGVEVGGTFTDLVAIDRHGIRVLKVPSTPHSPDEGAFNALVASGIFYLMLYQALLLFLQSLKKRPKILI